MLWRDGYVVWLDLLFMFNANVSAFLFNDNLRLLHLGVQLFSSQILSLLISNWRWLVSYWNFSWTQSLCFANCAILLFMDWNQESPQSQIFPGAIENSSISRCLFFPFWSREEKLVASRCLRHWSKIPSPTSHWKPAHNWFSLPFMRRVGLCATLKV